MSEITICKIDGGLSVGATETVAPEKNFEILCFLTSTHYNTDMSKIRKAIREAIEADERSRYRLAKETGISEPMLCLFMQGKRGMTLDRLERLAEHLNLEIVIRKRKRSK